MLSAVSLSSLKAFEAAARLGSFRDAAAELNLSASAVSHAIVALERSVGVPLFERHHRSVKLTPDGAVLMQHASVAFEELRTGLERISSVRSGLLRLHCAPTFATQVISPRLPRFLALFPDIEVKIAASTEYARFADGEFDADIVYGTPAGEDITVLPLGEETITPLCSPEMARTIGKADDLLSMVLIRSDLKRIQWQAWFAANSIPTAPTPGMSFDRSFMSIAAAANGLGVALESTLLACPELASGRLVAPLADRSAPLRYFGHSLVYPNAGSNRQLVRKFADWLIAEIGVEQPHDNARD